MTSGFDSDRRSVLFRPIFHRKNFSIPSHSNNHAIYLRNTRRYQYSIVIFSMPCCDKRITFEYSRQRYYVFNYSSEEHWAANLWKFPFASPSSVHSYSLRVESIREDLPRVEDLPLSFLEKNFTSGRRRSGRRSRQSCQDSWERKLPVLQLLSFIFFQPFKLDDETWSKVAERMRQ